MSIVSTLSLFIGSMSQGSRKIKNIESFSTSDGGSKEQVKNLGQQKIGKRRSVGSTTISLKVPLVTERDIDWVALRDSDEEFSLTARYEGGASIAYIRCSVSSVSFESDSDGNHSISVEILCLG